MLPEGSESPDSEDSPLRLLLVGGDRRSLARSAEAKARVDADPRRVAELAALAEDADYLVSLRALDMLEKIAREHPERVAPHRRVFIGRLADRDEWEALLQIVRALSLFEWSPSERKRAVQILRRALSHPQKFVRGWALDSLSHFASSDRTLTPVVRRAAAEFSVSGSPALRVRARRAEQALARSPRARKPARRRRPG